MLCLGIESSCDDTSLALVRDGSLLGQVASSQEDIHALFGGVVPEVASREHARLIGPLFDRLFEDTKITSANIDGVAVARGPGLLGSLLVGVAFAKAFALGCGIPFLGVNHLHAHLMAAGLEVTITYPALGLLVSGGHTHLYRIESPKDFYLLGKTLDDAAGEAFDKAGKMLGLPYPAGRLMDMFAEQGRADVKLFPRPYLRSGNLDFSFSGLKTAMYSYLAANPQLSFSSALPNKKEELADLCASYRLAVVDTLLAKARTALELPEQIDIQSMVLAGGVAANSLLRRSFISLANEFGKIPVIPSPKLCTDNGAMTAYLGYLLLQEGYAHNLDMEAIPRGRTIPNDYVMT